MKKEVTSSSTVKFVLCIGKEMFARESFLAYRPEPGEYFPVLGIRFICSNLNAKPGDEEPVIGELCSDKPTQGIRAILIDNSFMQLSEEEAQELTNQYLTPEAELTE